MNIKQKPEVLGWGIHFIADTEIEALRIGYAYRNSPHGYKVESAPNIGKWCVTVWNETAKEMGCDV